ncbi:MAG: hypothetical protein K9L78_03085 [Victivallales bacterium]|nr:hypothetical protein [Victivallales bacterium]MCF7889082.1 hypothetical protein [Victivallales bacterium]
MDAATITALGQGGAFAAIAMGAIGSALGTGAAGTSAVGAWKRCYAQSKPAPFQLVVFAGAPLSQTIYGMILMFILNGKVTANPGMWPLYLIIGFAGGAGLGMSALWQGKAAAASCDAFGETGKGFVNYLMALGIIETVAIFVMAFAIVLLATI